MWLREKSIKTLGVTMLDIIRQKLKERHPAYSESSLIENVGLITNSILFVSHLHDAFDKIPNVVLDNILDDEYYNKVVFPCYPIELRNILSSKRIYSQKVIPFFSFKISEKYLNRYPILLILDNEKIDIENGTVSYEFGGLVVFDARVVNIENALIDVKIKKPLDDECLNQINNIITDNGLEMNTTFENSIPGISSYNPKLAQDVTRKQVYDTLEEPMKDVGTPPNPLGLQIGTKVRWRNRGLLLNQYFGEVIKITTQWIFVEWDGKKGKVTTKFPVGNPAVIFKYLAIA